VVIALGGRGREGLIKRRYFFKSPKDEKSLASGGWRQIVGDVRHQNRGFSLLSERKKKKKKEEGKGIDMLTQQPGVAEVKI